MNRPRPFAPPLVVCLVFLLAVPCTPAARAAGPTAGVPTYASMQASAAPRNTPCIAGPTGLVRLPSAFSAPFVAAWSQGGDTVTHLNVAGRGFETGFRLRDGEWIRHLKVPIVADRGSKKETASAFALGLYGSGSDVEEQVWFVAFSSRDADSGLAFHWGMTRPDSGGTASYLGLDAPVTRKFRLKTDYDHRGDVWSVGAEYSFASNLTAFRYLLDIRENAPLTVKDRDITGVCFRKAF